MNNEKQLLSKDDLVMAYEDAKRILVELDKILIGRPEFALP